MAIKIRNILKGFFKAGDKPTEQQFVDVLDSYVHLQEDAARLLPGGGGAGHVPIKQQDGSTVWIAPEDAFPEIGAAQDTANQASQAASNAATTANNAATAAGAAGTKANQAVGVANSASGIANSAATTANNAASDAASAAALAAAAAPKKTIRKEISGNYVLAASDNNCLLVYKGTADITVTVPLSILTPDVSSSDGFACALLTRGLGLASWVNGTGVTVKHYEEKYRTIRNLPSGLFGAGDGMVIVSNTQF